MERVKTRDRDRLPRPKVRSYAEPPARHSYTPGTVDHRVVGRGRTVLAPAGLNSDSLQSWGEWRGKLNEVYIEKAVGPLHHHHPHPHPHHHNRKYATVTNRRSHHPEHVDDVGLHRHGQHAYIHESLSRDPRKYMKYALASNNATELTPEEFLKYGIPRAKINKHNGPYRDLFRPSSSSPPRDAPPEVQLDNPSPAEDVTGELDEADTYAQLNRVPRARTQHVPSARTQHDQTELQNRRVSNGLHHLDGRQAGTHSPHARGSPHTDTIPSEPEQAPHRPQGWSDVLRDLKLRVPVTRSHTSGSDMSRRSAALPPTPPHAPPPPPPPPLPPDWHRIPLN